MNAVTAPRSHEQSLFADWLERALEIEATLDPRARASAQHAGEPAAGTCSTVGSRGRGRATCARTARAIVTRWPARSGQGGRGGRQKADRSRPPPASAPTLTTPQDGVAWMSMVPASREGEHGGGDQQSRASAAFRWGWLRCVADVSSDFQTANRHLVRRRWLGWRGGQANWNRSDRPFHHGISVGGSFALRMIGL